MSDDENPIPIHRNLFEVATGTTQAQQFANDLRVFADQLEKGQACRLTLNNEAYFVSITIEPDGNLVFDMGAAFDMTKPARRAPGEG